MGRDWSGTHWDVRMYYLTYGLGQAKSQEEMGGESKTYNFICFLHGTGLLNMDVEMADIESKGK